MAQHRTEITQGWPAIQSRMARCTCGWVSKPHYVEQDAEADADEHVRQMVHAEPEHASPPRPWFHV